MNERIKELEQQAMTFRAGIQMLDTDKFAELIVKECIDIAYAYDAPKMSGPGMIVANRIEDHFGVEE